MRTDERVRGEGNPPQAPASSHAADLHIRVTCQTVSEFLDRHAADVSRGGIFVRNVQVLAVGRAVKLDLRLGDGSTLLDGEGTVFWTREADPTRAETEPGMGIRFTRLTAESQRMLAFMLAEKADRERADGSEFDDDERTVVATEAEIRAASSVDDSGASSISGVAMALGTPTTLPPPVSPALTSMAAHTHPIPTPRSMPVEGGISRPPVPGPVRTLLPSSLTASGSMIVPASAPAAAGLVLPVPAASSAAWEIEDARDEAHDEAPPNPFAAIGDRELTDLGPRGRRHLGIAAALAGVLALAACFAILSRPATKALPAPSTPPAAEPAALAVAYDDLHRAAHPATTPAPAPPPLPSSTLDLELPVLPAPTAPIPATTTP